MRAQVHKIMQLGDLVAAAFDEAGRRSENPAEVSRWATRAVEHALRLADRPALLESILALEGPDGARAPRAKYLAAARRPRTRTRSGAPRPATSRAHAHRS